MKQETNHAAWVSTATWTEVAWTMIVIAVLALWGILEGHAPPPAVPLLAAILILGRWFIMRWPDAPEVAENTAYSKILQKMEAQGDKVDPWMLQRKLMKISDQYTPPEPMLTNGMVLYAALIIEETGELYRTMGRVMYGYSEQAYGDFGADFDSLATRCKEQAKKIREQLPLWEFHADMVGELAVALFDDTTDIAVVNCGFALAAGLPGADGYAEVVSSNISKANPVTGKIDKHPDGKWIKGTAYVEPDLAKVLRERMDGINGR